MQHEQQSAAERLRSLVLQVALVGLVVLGALMVLDAVSEATTPATTTMQTGSTGTQNP